MPVAMRPTVALVTVALLASTLSGCLQYVEIPAELIPDTLLYKPREVKVVSNQLVVDGRVFVVKGVNYNPVPPGVDPRAAGGWSIVDHPEVYRQDFALMKKMGVNTLRIVNTTGNVPAMREFLDEAHRYGFLVILGHQGPVGENAGDPEVRERFQEEVRRMVDGYRLHPAVLMWLLGNNVNLRYPAEGSLDDWYSLLEETARSVKSLDSNHPVATALSGLRDVIGARDRAPSVDVIGVNQYMPDSIGWRQWFYPGYFASISDRPVLITEFGMDALDSVTGLEDETLQANVVRESWLEIAAQANGGFNQSIGGCVFEWTDGWWKRGDPGFQDRTPDWVPREGAEALPDGAFSEEWFGIVRVDPDTGERTPRALYHGLQAMWADLQEPSPPALANVSTATLGNTIRVVADVVTYGDVPVNVTLRYRLKADAWRETEMTFENGSFVATLGPFDGVAVLFYSVEAVDVAGRSMSSSPLTARAVPAEDAPWSLVALAVGAAGVALARNRGRRSGGAG